MPIGFVLREMELSFGKQRIQIQEMEIGPVDVVLTKDGGALMAVDNGQFAFVQLSSVD